jgi:hypothetical protein
LKANYDQQLDHIEMFVPFVMDAIAALPASDFTGRDLKDRITERYKLDVPVHTLDILLSRLWKRGVVTRDGGKYFRTDQPYTGPDLASARQRAEEEQRRLAESFKVFASTAGHHITDDDALALILDFFAKFHVYILLGEEEPTEILAHAEHPVQLKLVARDIERMRAEDSEFVSYIQRSLEGYIIQSALLMQGISWSRKSFSRLEVFFDTGFLFTALGYTGPFAYKAAQETLELLKATKASFSVFRRTVAEMQRILKIYELNLGSYEGIQRLILPI